MRKIAAALLVAVFSCGVLFAGDDILFLKAKRFQKEGQCAEAINLYGNYIDKFPVTKEAGDAQYDIGVCWLKLKKDDNALAAFTDAAEKYPDRKKAADSYLQIGSILTRQKKYDEAIKNYGIILDKYSDSQKAADAQYSIAACYEKMNDKDNAKKEYQKVIDKYPDSKKADRARGKIAAFNGRPAEKKPRRSPRLKKVPASGKEDTAIPARAVKKTDDTGGDNGDFSGESGDK